MSIQISPKPPQQRQFPCPGYTYFTNFQLYNLKNNDETKTN